MHFHVDCFSDCGQSYKKNCTELMCKVSFSLVGLAHLSIVRAVKLSNCKKKYYLMHLLHKLLLLTILKWEK